MVNMAAGLGLSDVRKRTSRSQAAVATSMGTTQSAVSRLERQADLRISTLRDYAEALGGRLRLIIEYGDEVVELLVGRPDDRAVEGRQSFRVIWQDGLSRALVHVGWLEHTTSGFEFSYTDEARRHERFTAFPAFPDLDEIYRSGDLFPYFAVRLISTADPNYQVVLEAIGLADRDPTPVELLTYAPDSQHDTIQIVPEPTESADGTLSRTFLVSGLRYADELTAGATSDVVARLEPGSHLKLLPEPSNPFNDQAIQLFHAGTQVGWLPDYLVDEVHGYIAAGSDVDVVVQRANGPDAPSHVRLQCRLVVSRRPVRHEGT